MPKTILVTGASTGVGAATIDLFAHRGWNAIATMRRPASSNSEKRDNVLHLPLDVTDHSSIEKALADGGKHFGSIDVVVNNAGYGEFGVFEAIDDNKIRANFEVNVFGVMNVIRAILPAWRKRKSGTIINVSSAGGIIGLPAIGFYLSTKFALEGFSESIWYELDALGICLKIVEPGVTASPMRSMRRLCDENSIFPDRVYSRVGQKGFKEA